MKVFIGILLVVVAGLLAFFLFRRNASAATRAELTQTDGGEDPQKYLSTDERAYGARITRDEANLRERNHQMKADPKFSGKKTMNEVLTDISTASKLTDQQHDDALEQANRVYQAFGGKKLTREEYDQSLIDHHTKKEPPPPAQSTATTPVPRSLNIFKKGAATPTKKCTPVPPGPGRAPVKC